MERTFPFLNLVSDVLIDMDVTDLAWNAEHGIWIKRRCSNAFQFFKPSPWKAPQLIEAWSPFISHQGARWSSHRPWCQIKWKNQYRMHFIFPPASPEGPCLSIRRISTQTPPHFWKNDPAFSFLLKTSQEKRNILIFGATGSGKSTLLTELLNQLCPTERLLLLEDQEEIETTHAHLVRLVSRPNSLEGVPEISLQTLLREGLRMNPSRILLGECRGEEVLELLMAMHLGHEGVLSTLHATHARDSLNRLEFLTALAAPQLPSERIRLLLSQTLHLLVHTQHDKQKGRHIRSVHEVAGLEGGTILLRPVIEQT